MNKFDDKYYNEVILKYGYNPVELRDIDFNLGEIKKETLNKKWLCHNQGEKFSQGLKNNNKCIITTGIGLSGSPHMGTISQILRTIFLQKHGFNVQFVLGDLDSYNARNQPLDVLNERGKKYYEFICNLGFDTSKGILRYQKNREDVLKTAYLISNCLKDADFMAAEEDLSKLYIEKGIYPGIEFSVKQAILLMVADFIHLYKNDNYENVLVMLGLEEHLYVQLANKVIDRMDMKFNLSSLYSRIIKGLNNYPKMSKSIPGSGITVEMKPDEIRNMIINNKEDYEEPMDSVIYQMMCAVSYYDDEKLDEIYEYCKYRDEKWTKYKKEYAEVLIYICSKWPK